MNDDIEFPNFKKIRAMIPNSLYDELSDMNIFTGNFDAWITDAIREKLKRSNNE